MRDSRWPDPDSLTRYDNVTVGDLVKGIGASDAFCKLRAARQIDPLAQPEGRPVIRQEL
ncbi:hypothetical protein [Methylobacterium marchantiae]|uniref:Uncharacterized protein n=1 Tax=Methylobacterium marchantiae TaxID=600331 RepID=A0ABW3WUG1_9HYPH|nr:hypothetical protein AIGOOFII_0669 [Methylobacterium marchantiae]